MLTIHIMEKGGEERRLQFDKSEVTIGRVQGNDVILPKGNVSKRHARIVLKEGKFVVVDLKSTNGTYVNGRKITSPLVIREEDKIYIGDFVMTIEPAGQQPVVVPPAAPPVAPPLTPPDSIIERAPTQAPIAASPVSQPVATPPATPRRTAAMIPPVAPSQPPMTQPPMTQPPMTQPPMTQPPAGNPRTIHTIEPTAPPSVAPASPSPTVPPPQPPASAPPAAEPPVSEPVGESSVAVRNPKLTEFLRMKESVVEEVIGALGIDSIPPEELLSDDGLWSRAEKAVAEKVQQLVAAGTVLEDNKQEVITDCLNEALAFGPLDDLLRDTAITEIVVDRSDSVWVRRGGAWLASGKMFSSDEILRRSIERIVAPSGQAIGVDHPLVDVRLPDGSRVTAAIPPVSVRGACMTIRRLSDSAASLEDLVNSQWLSAEMSQFLSGCVAIGKSVLVCGAPNTQRGMVLSALAGAIPLEQRVVSIEEMSHVNLPGHQWVALETAHFGSSDIQTSALVRHALQFAPDRMIIGELGTRSVVDTLMVTSTAVTGCLYGMTARRGDVGLAQLVNFARLESSSVSEESLRDILSDSIDIVVQLASGDGGVTRVVLVEELTGTRVDGFKMRPLFGFRDGVFSSTGQLPSFASELVGVGINKSLFTS